MPGGRRSYNAGITPGSFVSFRYFATCARGLEPLLASELAIIHAADIKVGRGGVEFRGDRSLIYRANLCLRTAVRVLRPILHADVHSSDDLYEAVQSADWAAYMTPDQTLAVIAENGRIISTELPAIESLLKSDKAAEAKANAAMLGTTADEWLKTIAGGVEGHWLKETLKQKLASATTETAALGLIARNISVLKQADDGKGFVIETSDEQPGFALIEVKQPTDRATEFRFRFKAAQKGMQNGGFAFGPSLDKLTRCQVLLRGRRLMIRDHVSSSAREEVPELDPDAEQECLVRVDVAKRTVRFTVGKSSVEAKLSDDAPVRFYGYVVEQTTSTFSPIELSESR